MQNGQGGIQTQVDPGTSFNNASRGPVTPEHILQVTAKMAAELTAQPLPPQRARDLLASFGLGVVAEVEDRFLSADSLGGENFSGKELLTVLAEAFNKIGDGQGVVPPSPETQQMAASMLNQLQIEDPDGTLALGLAKMAETGAAEENKANTHPHSVAPWPGVAKVNFLAKEAVRFSSRP